MKQLLFSLSISILLVVYNQRVFGQYLPLSNIKRSFDLTVSSAELKKDGTTYEFQIPYYELSLSDVGFGLAAIFALSKNYPERWVDDAIKLPNPACDSLKCGQRGYIFCEARRLFESDTVKLKELFDIYMFVIYKNELAGPYREELETGVIDYYRSKVGSTLFTYIYDNGRWIEINHFKQDGDYSPRVLGREIIDIMAKERMTLWLNSQ